MENARNANVGYPDCAAGEAAGNVIELQVGQTYTLPGANSGAVGLPFITRTLTINGHGSTLTRGVNAGAFRVLYVLASSLTLNDLTIQNIVLPNGADGAIYNDNGALTINRSIVRGTRVVAGGSGGGAITSRACSPAVLGFCSANSQASLVVADSAVDDNESRSTTSSFGAGAGINTYAVGNALNQTTILRSRFHANTATNQGAGVSNAAYDAGATSVVTIDRSSITANTTTGGTTPAFGGGLTNFVGKVYTGGAANASATLTITNTTIASNTAANSGAGDGFGGGIFSEVDCGYLVSCGGGSAARLTLRSVTMSGNASGSDSGGGRGAGIWSNNNDPTGSVTLDIRDSLLAANMASGTPGNCRLLNTAVVPAGYNIASDSSCGSSFHMFGDGQINLSPLNFSAFTYYQAPQSGSAAIDKTACGLAIDQIGTTRPKGTACEVGAIEVTALGFTRRTNADFNGDGRSDVGFFRPSVTPNALWYSPPTGGGAAFQTFFGTASDIPVAADYDGDGKADAAIWQPSTGLWYGLRTGTGTLVMQLALGQNGDIPVPCDYDGDGAVDPAIYRPSTGSWFGTRANGATVVLNTNFGMNPSDIPVPADYNGDGRCDPGIMRPGIGPDGTNLWYSVPSGGGSPFQIYFGAVGDIPVPADYDGDGKADAVIFRPSTGLWYGPRTGAAQIVTQFFMGQFGDIPVPGDYNGDGATDPAIYRPSTGMFFGTNAAGNTIVLNTNLGVVAGDIPIPERPHYQAAYPFLIFPSTTTAPSSSVTPSTSSVVAAADSTTRAATGTAALSTDSAVSSEALPGATLRAIPESGNGDSQLFTISVENPDGSVDIRAVLTIINATLTGARSCLVAYDRVANTLQLADDAGTAWSSPLLVGGAGTAANSQCTVNAVGSSVAFDVNTLTLVIPVTFDAGFAGPKTIYGAVDTASVRGSWQSLGAWTVPSAHAPSVSQTALSGSGFARTFTFSASARDGAAGIGAIHAMINSTLTGTGSCFVRYDGAAGTLQLADDSGTNWSSALPVGGAGTIANSQCVVHADGSSAIFVANTLTVAIKITFDPGFAGPKTIYGQALDAGGDGSNWQPLGTWIVPSAQAPSVSLASPLSGAGLTQTLAFTASTRNGAAHISAIQTIINSTLTSVGSCFVSYDPTTNTLQLADDAGTGWSSPLPVGGAGSITNSQCAVHAAGSSVSAGADTLTLMIPITFDSGFAGPKTIYGLALDAVGGSSNWQSLGSWDVPTVSRR